MSIGTGTVSDDGAMIESDPGVGIIKGGWHCGGDPQEVGGAENAHIDLLDSPDHLVLEELEHHLDEEPPASRYPAVRGAPRVGAEEEERQEAREEE